MNKFKRGLRPAALAALDDMANSPDANWWIDLLALWAPSGTAKGERCLRLAVRHNYLNFYSNGQSIARVTFDIHSQPRVEVHVKYAIDDATQEVPIKSAFNGAPKRTYAMLTGSTVKLPDGRFYTYAGPATLRKWISQATELKTQEQMEGAEKTAVDRLVANNGGVIDLEMGLPAHLRQDRALRMDLVALEPDQSGARIVFVEVKLVTDDALKKSKSKQPKVMEQIERYSLYLGNPEHVKAVKQAYRVNCKTLLRFVEMAARKSGEVLDLDPIIAVAADENKHLGIDVKPRLVIFGTDNQLSSPRWRPHEATLCAGGACLQTLITGSDHLTFRNSDSDTAS